MTNFKELFEATKKVRIKTQKEMLKTRGVEEVDGEIYSKSGTVSFFIDDMGDLFGKTVKIEVSEDDELFTDDGYALEDWMIK